MENDIETPAKELREECLEIEKRIRMLMNHPVFTGEPAFSTQHGEMKAHIMLAVRHMEDARMRLGKVCQYAGTWMSGFDNL